MIAMVYAGLVSCSKDDAKQENVAVSPTAISLLSTQGSVTSVRITSDGSWTIENAPDWLHLSATSGTGTTDITLTARSDNFSDELRSATLIVATETNSSSFNVSQEPYLSKNCRVYLSDKTVMCDGFAADLTFEREARGYREAFFTESAIASMTERDIYNLLMQQTEYTSTADYTFSPIVAANTALVYCVAAYGNENFADGTHKYGPMTMEHIKISSETLYADMPIANIAYSTQQWVVSTEKQGAMGTRCQKYYYFAAEGDNAFLFYMYYASYPYAWLAHFLYKPVIAESPDTYAIAAQSFYYSRSTNNFFFGTWGVDDTGAFSAEHIAKYREINATLAVPMEKKIVDSAKWNEARTMPTKVEIESLRKNVKVFVIQ